MRRTGGSAATAGTFNHGRRGASDSAGGYGANSHDGGWTQSRRVSSSCGQGPCQRSDGSRKRGKRCRQACDGGHLACMNRDLGAWPRGIVSHHNRAERGRAVGKLKAVGKTRGARGRRYRCR